jgi:hypothetical protein
MKVVYRTRLSAGEVIRRLSENTEEEGFFFTKRNVLIGDIQEESDVFEIKKLLSSIRTKVEIRGTITRVAGGSLIETQIYTGGNGISYNGAIGFISIVAMIAIIITHWNEYDKSFIVVTGTLFGAFWVFGLCIVENAEEKVKKELKEIFDAEIE